MLISARVSWYASRITRKYYVRGARAEKDRLHEEKRKGKKPREERQTERTKERDTEKQSGGTGVNGAGEGEEREERGPATRGRFRGSSQLADCLMDPTRVTILLG